MEKYCVLLARGQTVAQGIAAIREKLPGRDFARLPRVDEPGVQCVFQGEFRVTRMFSVEHNEYLMRVDVGVN